MIVTARAMRGRSRDVGFSLIEVVVASALLAIILAPVVGAVLGVHDRVGEAVRLLSAGPGRSDQLVAGVDPWSWSPAGVCLLGWEGSSARLAVSRADGSDAIEVGCWVDGWFLSLTHIDTSGQGECVVAVPLDPAGVHGVVFRAREIGGSWGIPWRTIWPPLALPQSAARGADERVGIAQDGADAIVAAHAGAAGLSEVGLMTSSSTVRLEGQQLPAALIVEGGVIGVECNGFLQALWAGPGGLAHLYF